MWRHPRRHYHISSFVCVYIDLGFRDAVMMCDWTKNVTSPFFECQNIINIFLLILFLFVCQKVLILKYQIGNDIYTNLYNFTHLKKRKRKNKMPKQTMPSRRTLNNYHKNNNRFAALCLVVVPFLIALPNAVVKCQFVNRLPHFVPGSGDMGRFSLSESTPIDSPVYQLRGKEMYTGSWNHHAN